MHHNGGLQPFIGDRYGLYAEQPRAVLGPHLLYVVCGRADDLIYVSYASQSLLVCFIRRDCQLSARFRSNCKHLSGRDILYTRPDYVRDHLLRPDEGSGQAVPAQQGKQVPGAAAVKHAGRSSRPGDDLLQ